jgi:hypothetical protein
MKNANDWYGGQSTSVLTANLLDLIFSSVLSVLIYGCSEYLYMHSEHPYLTWTRGHFSRLESVGFSIALVLNSTSHLRPFFALGVMRL